MPFKIFLATFYGGGGGGRGWGGLLNNGSYRRDLLHKHKKGSEEYSFYGHHALQRWTLKVIVKRYVTLNVVYVLIII